MKLQAALLIFLVIFAATATSFVFEISSRQIYEKTVDDSIEHQGVLQIDNETTVDPIIIDTPGGPG
jgi:hypothetical protein